MFYSILAIAAFAFAIVVCILQEAIPLHFINVVLKKKYQISWIETIFDYFGAPHRQKNL